MTVETEGQQFLLHEPRLGTLDLSCVNGYVVESYEIGFPNPRVSSEPRTFDHGEYDTTRFHGASTVTLDVGLNGDVTACALLRDRLRAFLHPSRRPTLTVTEPGDSGRTKVATLRGHTGGVPIANPAYNRMAVSWVCPDGVFTGTTMRQLTLRPGGGTVAGRTYNLTFNRDYPDAAPAGAQVAENDGNTDAHWTCRLYGAMANPKLYCDDQVIEFTANTGLSLIAQQMTLVTSRGHRVELDANPATSRADRVNLATSTWWLIPPGVSNLRLDADAGYGVDAQAVIEWYDTWI